VVVCGQKMELFQIISNAKIKKQCEKDFKEFEICIAKSCYKASLVLAGGIIESLLYDFILNSPSLQLEVENFEKRNIGLEELIQISRKNQILRTDTIPLLDKIKNYRNSIHPNLYIRQDIRINKNIAGIAKSCIHEVLNDINESLQKIKYNDQRLIVTEIVIKKTKRKPLLSEIKLFSSILEKYGIRKGSRLVEKSLENIAKEKNE
jgi:hypothetical protein